MKCDDSTLFRAAYGERLQAFSDELMVHLKRYYKVPDDVRVIVEQGMQHALAVLFDPQHYPEGMSRAAIVDYADAHLEPLLKETFAPHHDALLVEGKWNRLRDGTLRNNLSWNDVDRTIPMYSSRLVDDLRAIDARLTQEASLPHEIETPAANVQTQGMEHAKQRVKAPDYAKVPFVSGNDMVSREWLASQELEGFIADKPALTPFLAPVLEAVKTAKPPPRAIKTVARYLDWVEKDSAIAFCRKLDLVDGLRAPERKLIMDAYKELIPAIKEEAMQNGDYLYEHYLMKDAQNSI